MDLSAIKNELNIIELKQEIFDLYFNNKKYLKTIIYTKKEFELLNLYDLKTILESFLLFIPKNRERLIIKCSYLYDQLKDTISYNSTF